MNDEYGNLEGAHNIHVFPEFNLDSGIVLKRVPVAYHSYGTLNHSKSNVIVVCHALTGNSDCAQWWSDLVGPAKPIDTLHFFVICCNVIGSCYGTLGPRSIGSDNAPYGGSFPNVTIRDCVALHWKLLKEVLNISQVHCVIGGSLGGMQALEWLLLPRVVRLAVVIACGSHHTAWQIAFGETQRQAIYADSNWKDGSFSSDAPPRQGLAVARMIAMISYRSHDAYIEKFGRSSGKAPPNKLAIPSYDVEDYLRYQGERILSRFDAASYVALTRLMDTHDIQKGRGVSVEEVLSGITQPVLVVGIDSDVLYPLSEQMFLHKYIPKSSIGVIRSNAGHDGFLLESQQLSNFIVPFLRAHPPPASSKL